VAVLLIGQLAAVVVRPIGRPAVAAVLLIAQAVAVVLPIGRAAVVVEPSARALDSGRPAVAAKAAATLSGISSPAEQRVLNLHVDAPVWAAVAAVVEPAREAVAAVHGPVAAAVVRAAEVAAVVVAAAVVADGGPISRSSTTSCCSVASIMVLATTGLPMTAAASPMSASWHRKSKL